MSRNIQILKKAVLTLAILLMTTASAWALEITFTQNNQNINTNYTVSSTGENVTINVPSGWTCTYSGVISGGNASTCTITKTGAGKVIITKANTVSGSTVTISAGTLQLGNGTADGTFNNMTSWSISSGATLRFETSAINTNFSKVISGAGKVEFKAANKNLIFTANNTYTGTTTIEAGILSLGNITTTGSIVGNIINNDQLSINRTNTYTYSGIISGTGMLHQYGTGTTILTGENTYTGETRIQQGKLQVGNGTSITASIESTSGVWFVFETATLRFEPGNNMVFTKLIDAQGGGNVEFKGGGSKSLNLTAKNRYTGTTTIESGSLAIGNNTTSGAIAGNIINNGVLHFYCPQDYTYSGVISGPGSVYKISSGKLILTGANTYGGETRVNGGTLQVGNGTSATASIESTSGVTLNLASVLRFDLGADMTFSKEISGTGKMEFKAGNRDLKFTGNNTYTGGTTIDGGYLFIGTGGTTGSIAGNVNILSGTLIFDRSDVYIFNGIISGAGNVGKSVSAGKTILTGENTYTGETAILGGTLQVGNGTSGSIANTSKVTILQNGTLRLEPGAPMTFSQEISGSGKVEYKGTIAKSLNYNAKNTYTGTTTIEAGALHVGKITMTGAIAGNIINNGWLAVYCPQDYTYTGIISGSGSVSKYASGKLILTGANTYSGETTIYAGTLQLGNNTTTGSISGNSIINNATLRFARSNNYTYSGVISGTGDVEQYGSGDLIFKGVNTYTGETRLHAPLAFSEGGSIENSSEVILFDEPKAILDISAHHSKIKALSSKSSGSGIVRLGSKTLTIGTSGEGDGTGNFSGKFTGKEGNVTKTGTGVFTMSGANETEGIFTHSQGTVKFSGIWAGDYMKGPGATLTVVGNPTIGKMLKLEGGAVNMNLKTTPPSKLSVTGAVEAAQVMLTINTNAISNYVLMEAASGIKPEAYMVNSILHSHLSGNNMGTQLLFSASKEFISPKITINKIPYGVTGTKFSETLTAVGLNPITWKIENKSLPDGLSFNEQTGEISGTPTQTGTFPLRVRATNSLGSDVKDLYLIVSNDVVAPTIITTQLPYGTIDVSYNNNLDIEGSSSITWTLQSGDLPDGLTLSSKGVISGTPTALGSSTFTVKAENSAGQDTKELTLLITDGLGIAPTTLSNRITVYPNPTTGELTIDMSDMRYEMSDMRCEIYDIYGKKMSQISNLKSQISNQINISHLPAGVYFLRIQTENKMITQKIIKQ